MRLVYALADAFINTFGITQPSQKTRRQAAWFILGMLALVVGGLVLLGGILFRVVRG